MRHETALFYSVSNCLIFGSYPSHKASSVAKAMDDKVGGQAKYCLKHPLKRSYFSPLVSLFWFKPKWRVEVDYLHFGRLSVNPVSFLNRKRAGSLVRSLSFSSIYVINLIF
jgi:hypothetical protein